MIVDYHLHTEMSDGKGIFEDYIKQAIKKSIDEIGFSDHINLKNAIWSMKLNNVNYYFKRLSKLRSNEKLVKIKIGAEMDFDPKKLKETFEFLKKYKFDYVIGSVHLIKNWCITNEKELYLWKKHNVDFVYKNYYESIQKMAKSKVFDIVGHFDVIKKFNFKPEKDNTDIVIETLQIIKKSKMCLEINTSGLKHPCQEIYPGKKILDMCFDMGIKITLGSDSHLPIDVGYDFKKTLYILKNIGFEKIVVFENRKPKEVELG